MKTFISLRLAPQDFSLNDQARFWDCVDITSDDKCWLWMRPLNRKGYGKFFASKRLHMAHRFAFSISRGIVPENFCVLHRCDTPPCVNPNHLFVGTLQDNAKDCVSKGRQSRGEKHGNSILAGLGKPPISQSFIDLVDARFKAGDSKSKIARDFNICDETVHRILNRLGRFSG